MKSTRTGLALTCCLGVSGLASAAPAETFASATKGLSPIPVTISSDASMEILIKLADTLARDSNSSLLASLKNQLDTLKNLKKGLIEHLLQAKNALAGEELGRHDPNRLNVLAVQIEALKLQLANVENLIKEVLKKIERLRQEEEKREDERKRAQDALARLQDALVKTQGRAYGTATTAASMGAYVSGLSSVKRQDTANKVRLALAQLEEARRIRAAILMSVSGAALQTWVTPTPRK